MKTLRFVISALLGALALLLLLAPAATVAAQGNPPQSVLLSNGYRVTFRGVTNNADGTSTWRYFVEELPSAQDLCNWVLVLGECADILAAGPEPWEEVHPDPNAQLDGIKWQTGGGFQQGEFTVTLAGQWAVGTTQVAAKGPDLAFGEIAGPSCAPSGGGASFALSKSVFPATARVGEVVTYTVQMRNEGAALAQNVVITDPLPGGTSYVDQSLGFSGGAGEYVAGERLIRWQGDLQAGETATVTFRVRVDAADNRG